MQKNNFEFLVFIIALVRGVRNYDANLIMLYIFSLFIRIFVYIVILVAFLAANLLEGRLLFKNSILK